MNRSYSEVNKEKIRNTGRTEQRTGRSEKTICLPALLLLALLWSALFAVPAFAGGPGQFASMDGEVYARLQDNTAEWSEIPDLVTYYNPTYRTFAESANATNDMLSDAGDSFREEMDANLETIDKNLESVKAQRESLSKLPGSMVIDAKGTTVAQALAQLDMTETMLKDSRKQVTLGMGKALTSITKTRISTDESLKPVREQIAKAVESLFISYAQLKINRSLVEKQIALYETALEARKTMKEKDMATELEVRQAEASLNEAKITLQTVDNGIAQLQTAIGLQLGWDAEHPPVIGEVPAPDLNYVAAADKEADYAKALANNKTYEKTGELSGYKGSSAVVQRDAAVNEANGNASAKFDALYAEMQKQKLLYDAAQTSLKRAKITRDQTERLMKLGLVGKAEYEGKQLEYISYEASVKLAALSLTSAINDYQWAVRGYMDY